MGWIGNWDNYYISDIDVAADKTSDVIGATTGKKFYVTGILITGNTDGKITFKSSDTDAITGPIYIADKGGGVRAREQIPSYLFKTATGEPLTVTTSNCAVGGWVEGFKEA